MKPRFFLVILAACFVLILGHQPSHAYITDTKTITDQTKTWTITFNEEVNLKTATDQTIYVNTSQEERHPISISLSDNSNQIIVKPKKPYLLGPTYTLVVSKDVQSKSGKKLVQESKLDFKVTGIYIKAVQAIANPLVTNVKVQVTESVSTVTVSMGTMPEQNLFKTSDVEHTRGFMGLMARDQLLIRAYDSNGKLLEEQLYELTD